MTYRLGTKTANLFLQYSRRWLSIYKKYPLFFTQYSTFSVEQGLTLLGKIVAGCPSYDISILIGECWFFSNDQHSPIIKKISILKILVSSNSPDFEY